MARSRYPVAQRHAHYPVQPEWIDAALRGLRNKNSNVKLQVGATFSERACKTFSSARGAQLRGCDLDCLQAVPGEDWSAVRVNEGIEI